MQNPVRLSLIAAALLAAPSLAGAAVPKKIVCQLEQGVVVEASFGAEGLSKDLRVFRQGPGLAQVTRIAKEDVNAFVGQDGIALGVDKDVGGLTKRVLYVSWSPRSSAAEVLPTAIMPKSSVGEPLPAQIGAAKKACTAMK